MLRQLVPRLSGPARLASRRLRAPGAVNKVQPTRAFGDRWLPVRRDCRGSWLEDFFRPGRGLRGPFSRDVWDQMAKMEREMGEKMRDFTPWTRWAEGVVQRGFNNGKVVVVREDGHFKVQVDVGQCPAEGVTVKTAGDKLVIRAEATRDADRIVSKREINIAIPEEVEADTFESLLANDGILTVSARMKEAPPPEEKVIEVKQQVKKDTGEEKGGDK